MNYNDFQTLPGERTPRPRKPNFMLLLILAFMAFFLFSQFRKAKSGISAKRGNPGLPSAPAENPAPSMPIPNIVIPDISNDGPKKPIEPATPRRKVRIPKDWAPYEQESDWSLDTDVEVDQPREVTIGSSKVTVPPRAESGDWTLEVGESSAKQAAPPKSTRKGDWEVSEVETSK